jgi:hypothetical protein
VLLCSVCLLLLMGLGRFMRRSGIHCPGGGLEVVSRFGAVLLPPGGQTDRQTDEGRPGFVIFFPLHNKVSLPADGIARLRAQSLMVQRILHACLSFYNQDFPIVVLLQQSFV